MKYNFEKLDPEFKKDWITALRSGNYKQGAAFLFNPETITYCCLGVAGAISGISNDSLRRKGTYSLGEIINNSEIIEKLPKQFWGDTEPDSMKEALISFNDGEISFANPSGKRRTFKFIAKWIEKYL